jgi:hypothetical protein
MAKPVFKRVSMTLDLETIRKCRTLANEKAQSVSAFVRYLVAEAFQETVAAKEAQESRNN